MRASRLISILITLQLRGRVSARELAARLEVSKRTIYRDVDELSAAGVPIYADRGAAGGFALLDGWRTQLTGMTAGEAAALAFAGLPATAAALGLGTEAVAAQLKVLAALPSASSEGARRVTERFHLDPTPWHRRPATPLPLLRSLAQAVWDARRIRIDYQSWNGASTRMVEPLGIVLKAGEWYFVARQRGRQAIYRLDKVTSLAPLPETFGGPAGFDLASAWREAVDRFEAGLRRSQAVLRMKSSALSRIDRLGAEVAEPLLAAAPDADGVRMAAVAIESVSHAASLLLGFADDIEVVSPASLRDELRRRAAAVVALYGPKRRRAASAAPDGRQPAPPS